VINALLLAAELTCGHYTIDNRSKEPVTDFDLKVADKARDECQKRYPNNPCLKTLIKWKPLSHSVICGPKPKIVGEENG
jgi:hypothetical protein